MAFEIEPGYAYSKERNTRQKLEYYRRGTFQLLGGRIRSWQLQWVEDSQTAPGATQLSMVNVPWQCAETVYEGRGGLRTVVVVPLDWETTVDQVLWRAFTMWESLIKLPDRNPPWRKGAHFHQLVHELGSCVNGGEGGIFPQAFHVAWQAQSGVGWGTWHENASEERLAELMQEEVDRFDRSWERANDFRNEYLAREAGYEGPWPPEWMKEEAEHAT